MLCTTCGTQNPDGAAFCSRCGSHVSSPGAPPLDFYSGHTLSQSPVPNAQSQSVAGLLLDPLAPGPTINGATAVPQASSHTLGSAAYLLYVVLGLTVLNLVFFFLPTLQADVVFTTQEFSVSSYLGEAGAGALVSLGVLIAVVAIALLITPVLLKRRYSPVFLVATIVSGAYSFLMLVLMMLDMTMSNPDAPIAITITGYLYVLILIAQVALTIVLAIKLTPREQTPATG